MELACNALEYINQKDLTTELQILDQSHELFGNDYRKNSLNKIIIVHHGNGRIHDGRATAYFKAPCCFLYTSFQPFCYEELSPDFESDCIAFSNSFYSPPEIGHFQGYQALVTNDPEKTSAFLQQNNNYSSLRRIVDEVRTELSQDIPDRELLLNYLNIVFLKVFRAVQAETEELQAGLNYQLRKNFINRITQLVDTHFKSEKRTTFYANELCIAPNTLTKYMKKYFGLSLTQLIHDRIIMEAKKEFYLTDKTIKEIAFDLGFDDPLYFSRLFKKLTRLCPSAYRG